MKISLKCYWCWAPNEQGERILTLVEMPPSDNNTYRIICPHGHESGVYLWDQKFELLFEIAVNAFVDGYYREAVATAAASLERCYEFFIRFFYSLRDIDGADFESLWKRVSRQSERQLGMFIGAYSMTFNSSPKLLDEDQKGKIWVPSYSFRNNVIHRGEVPTRERALAYLEAVLTIASELIDKVKGKFGKELASHLQSTTLKAIPDNCDVAFSLNPIMGLGLTRLVPSSAILNLRIDWMERRKQGEAPPDHGDFALEGLFVPSNFDPID